MVRDDDRQIQLHGPLNLLCSPARYFLDGLRRRSTAFVVTPDRRAVSSADVRDRG